jgi:2-keto-4-pentenoate hydratase
MASTAETPDVIESAGAMLFAAFEDGRAIAPLTEACPELSALDAYRIQRQLIAHHVAAGRTVRGRKIGLTSEAIQRQLGVASPDYGVLLDSHIFASGATLSRCAARMVAPRLEAELAFVLDRPLGGPAVSAADVLAATRAILPVFEVIDSRIADWRITLADTIADNASCFGAVVGAEVQLTDAGDLSKIEMHIERDGVEVASGTGGAVLGHPAVAVAWLANELARLGDTLPANELILSGSFGRAVDAEPGHYRAIFSDPLAGVEVSIER